MRCSYSHFIDEETVALRMIFQKISVMKPEVCTPFYLSFGNQVFCGARGKGLNSDRIQMSLVV